MEGDESIVTGMLDITKCLIEALAKLERVNESSKKLTDAINQVQMEFPTQRGIGITEFLVSQLGVPDLAGLIESSSPPPIVSLSSSVLNACKIMKRHHETAVLVLDCEDPSPHLYSGQIAGIFTSKDVVLRVLAAGLDPKTTNVLNVMTPHRLFRVTAAECASPQTTVLEALKKMNAGRYLHLPVVDSSGTLEGLVDVLKLTYSTLDQLNSLSIDTGPGL